jgi:hypothetical protein
MFGLAFLEMVALPLFFGCPVHFIAWIFALFAG